MTDYIAGIEESPGNPVHFQSHLLKHLLKNRKDFYQKNKNYHCHHAKHDQRIGDSASDLLGDFLFLFIMFGKTVHNFIQAAGFLACFYIGIHRCRETADLFQCLGKRTVFFHRTDQRGKYFTVCIGFTFITENMKAFCGGYAGMQKHSHLPAETG